MPHFSAYFDESTGNDSPVLVVAGLAARRVSKARSVANGPSKMPKIAHRAKEPFLHAPITDRLHAGTLIAFPRNTDRNHPGILIAFTQES